MKISLIIPCHNEEKAIPFLYEELDKVSKELSKYEMEFLFVNDGSTDGTIEILRELAAKDVRIHYYSFSRNFGKEAAMYAGFCNAAGDYVAVMDADLQDPPSLLPEMVRILEEEDYDSVATRRVSRAGEPPIRSFFARQFYKLINKLSSFCKMLFIKGHILIIDTAFIKNLTSFIISNYSIKGIFSCNRMIERKSLTI